MHDQPRTEALAQIRGDRELALCARGQIDRAENGVELHGAGPPSRANTHLGGRKSPARVVPIYLTRRNSVGRPVVPNAGNTRLIGAGADVSGCTASHARGAARRRRQPLQCRDIHLRASRAQPAAVNSERGSIGTRALRGSTTFIGVESRMSFRTSTPGMTPTSSMPRRVRRKSPTCVAKKTRLPARTARRPQNVISST